MKTNVEAVGENEVVLAVEVPITDVEAGIQETIRRLAQETTIPGFRKGRIPREILVNRLGMDYVLGQTLNDSLPGWYEAAVDAAELEPVSMPDIDFDADDFDGEGAFSFTAKLQVRPEPQLGAYTGLEVPRRPAEVTEGQVDAQLAMLQERFATLGPVEGRAVVEGDFVVLDFEGFVDGRPFEGASATDYSLEVGRGQLVPGFEEALVGIAAGGQTEFEVTFPDDYREEQLRGKPVTFKAKVTEIKEKIVPELSDGFAADASEFDTLDELRADVRGRLETVQTAAVDREFRAAVVGAAVENATVAIPPAMVERQAHALYHELESTVGEQGMEMEAYLQAIEKTAAEVEEELRPRAEAIVKQGLVLAAIRAAEDIEVSDEELRGRIMADAEALGREPEQLVLDVYASGRQNLIRDELVMAKTVDFLVERAVAVDESGEVAAGDGGSPPSPAASKPKSTRKGRSPSEK